MRSIQYLLSGGGDGCDAICGGGDGDADFYFR